MTTMKKTICLLVALALLLSFGCKKDEPVETTDPTEPTAEAPSLPGEQTAGEAGDAAGSAPEINTWPALTPDVVLPQEEPDDQDAWEAAFNSYREVGYFMEWQLGEDYHIIETLPGDRDGEYQLWGMRIVQPGLREPFRMKVKVTPDGKDFSLLTKENLAVTEEWKAVQNYRWLVTNCSQGPDQLLEGLGFDSSSTENVTSIPYADFQAAMLKIMTQEMYDTHWADLFSDEDGKLAFVDFGGSGFHYIVEMVQPQAEGGWLSYEFIHGYFDSFSTFFVEVELEEQPDGTFRVAGWDPDNTAIMEQAASALPITAVKYDADGDGQLSAGELPRPTGEKMGLTGEDAVLYTALAGVLEPTDDTLTLLSVDVLGSYPGEDGETHYVCNINESHFHGASYTSGGLRYDSMGGRGYLSRVTIALDGLLEYTYSTEDGADNTDREKEIFGPLTEQYTAWKAGEIIPGAYRLVPTGEELLAAYQAACLSAD